MHISHAIDPHAWDAFLSQQPWSPFLQSFTMGNVYQDIGQKPIRLIAELDSVMTGICFAHIVPARRGKHLSVPYGPVIAETMNEHDVMLITQGFVSALKKEAQKLGCSFLRISPFWAAGRHHAGEAAIGSMESPLHLLAEHVWYLPLRENSPSDQPDRLAGPARAGKNEIPRPIRHGRANSNSTPRTEQEILMAMRSTTRNLVRRAERDGVRVSASKNPNEDLKYFLALHEETRKRHRFTPYSDAFFASQVRRFAERKECTLYLAEYQGKIISASIHMHAFGETSYHHGASDSAHSKIPASYLLQWTAIKDALKRGDRFYNFWGIAPISDELRAMSDEQKGGQPAQSSKLKAQSSSHPFSGVTLFKTGFGGKVLNLVHCKDTPVTKAYWLTHAFEKFRKWRRGF